MMILFGTKKFQSGLCAHLSWQIRKWLCDELEVEVKDQEQYTQDTRDVKSLVYEGYLSLKARRVLLSRNPCTD